MICKDCHDIIEEYIKIQVKVSKEIVKEKRKQTNQKND